MCSFRCHLPRSVRLCRSQVYSLAWSRWVSGTGNFTFDPGGMTVGSESMASGDSRAFFFFSLLHYELLWVVIESRVATNVWG